MRRLRWLVGFALLVAPPASAGEYQDWWGAHFGTGLQAVQGPGLGTVLSQIEFDYRAQAGDWFFRVDLDYHFDPVFFSEGVDDLGAYFTPHYPLPPEFAVVQYRPGKFYVRAGVTNPDMGIQLWDEKDNYLPTFSNGWGLQNGQNLGVEVGVEFDDGTDFFAWAGYDISWFTPGFGAGVQTEQDFFATWTGAFYNPWLQYAGLWTANEIYPLDQLWLTLELDAGLVGTAPFAGGQLMANLFPESMVGGAVRADVQFYPDEAAEHLEFDVDAFAASGAVRFSVPHVALAVEAKESWPRNGGEPYFTGTLYAAGVFGSPEPYLPYSVADEE